VAIRTLIGTAAVKAAVGEELGVSDWLTIDQGRIDAFADITEDHQWIHVDVERAAAGPFGAPIAHGYLTLSLLPALTASTYQFDGFAMKVNYGLDRVRFPTPVHAGSRLRLRPTLQSATDTPRGLQVTIHALIETEDEKVVCAADTVSLLVE
jgi:acyl dehydratase